MTYIPPNPNGQATSSGSAPVVIASDQSAVSVSSAVPTLGNGSKAVTTAGTDVALAASTTCKWVAIEAYRANCQAPTSRNTLSRTPVVIC